MTDVDPTDVRTPAGAAGLEIAVATIAGCNDRDAHPDIYSNDLGVTEYRLLRSLGYSDGDPSPDTSTLVATIHFLASYTVAALEIIAGVIDPNNPAGDELRAVPPDERIGVTRRDILPILNRIIHGPRPPG